MVDKPYVAVSCRKAKWIRIAAGDTKQEAAHAALRRIGRGTIVDDIMRSNLRIVTPAEAIELCGPEP